LSEAVDAFDHAIYVSVIEGDVEDREVTIAIKVFEDDFRDALRAMYGRTFQQLSADNHNDILLYFQDHFEIQSDHGLVNYGFSDITLEGESYHIHLSATLPNSTKLKGVKSDFLMDLFPQQRNILHFTNGDQKQFEMMELDHKSVSLD